MYAMRRSLTVGRRSPHLVARGPSVLAALLATALVACGGDEGGAPPAAPAEPVAPAAPAAGTKTAAPADTGPKVVDPSTAGSISGTVGVTGTPPARDPLELSGDVFCIQSHEGGLHDESLLVAGGKLQNAFVWIKEGVDGYEFAAPTEPVVMDQVGCVYVPHIVGVQLDQPMMVSTSDPVLHNVHTHPELNREQNSAMPAGSEPKELRLKKPEVMIRVACDVHTWMTSWIGVVEHPHFAVTGADGAWRLDGVPPGDYTIGVWHETLGEREFTVTVGAKADVVTDPVVYAF